MMLLFSYTCNQLIQKAQEVKGSSHLGYFHSKLPKLNAEDNTLYLTEIAKSGLRVFWEPTSGEKQEQTSTWHISHTLYDNEIDASVWKSSRIDLDYQQTK